MFGDGCKFSGQCKVQGLTGIKRLDRIGTYLVIANRTRFEEGDPHRFAVVNVVEKWVDSVHGSHRSALKRAQKLIQAQ